MRISRISRGGLRTALSLQRYGVTRLLPPRAYRLILLSMDEGYQKGMDEQSTHLGESSR